MKPSPRVRALVGSLRHDANDTTTAGGRSRERYRRAAITSAAGIVARGASTIALLVAIGIVGNAMGTEAFGLWVLLVSGVALLGFADLGIGYGLLNHVSSARGRDDIDATRRAISSAFFALVLLAVLLGVAFALLSPHIPWDRLLNLPPHLADDGRAAIAVFFACVVVSLPLAVAQRVHLAFQEGYWAHLWSTLGSAISLVAVILAARLHPSLPVFTLAMLGGAPFAYLCNTVALFGRQHRDVRPRLRLAHRRDAAAILRTGGVFFVLSLAYAVGFQSDTIVISHYLGPDAVATYSVPLRLFLLTPLLTSLLVAPLWPAYGEAVQRADHEWVRRTIIRSVALTVALVAPVSIVLVFAGRPILAAWVPNLEPSITLLVWMAVWALLYAVTATLSMFFNGASVIRFQLVIGTAMAVTNLVLSIVLVQRFGVIGPVAGSVIAQGLTVLVPMIVLLAPLVRAHDTDASRRWFDRWASPATTTP